MRCLQCTKPVPLLKRLAGNEFCSDAHRREYQQEYSQLALGRLLQSKATEPEKNPIETEPRLAISTPEPAAPAPSPAFVSAVKPSVPKPPPPMVARSEPARVAVKPSTPPPKPNGNVPTRPLPLPAAKQAASEPAFAKPASILKPPPAKFQMAVMVTAEFERAFSTMTVDRPVHHANVSTAELPQGRPLRWEHRVEITDSAMQPRERKLDLREPLRPAPRIDLDLGILAAESLESPGPALAIPMLSSVAPPEASLWTASHKDFTGSVISLDEFANSYFSSTGFEEISIVDAPQPRADIEAPPPEPVLTPLPVEPRGIAAGKPKPVQVFGAALFSGGPVQVPQPSGLPLRPMMVLGPAVKEAPAAVPVSGSRKPDVRIFPPAAKKPASLATEPDLGLPELRFQPTASAGASRMRNIMVAVAGAAAIGIGMLLFFGGKSDAGSKQTAGATVRDDQWIANFAADPKRQRKVSVLRSSMGLPAYRMEFESSIQIKGLGWVYRAQDPKNFYVSKIELQRPGPNPAFVIVHYAVINGVDQPRVEAPLPVAVPLGRFYKIRFSAVGDRFTTWVQDRQVDQWTDARLKTGGAGLYNEGAEQSILRGDFRVIPQPREK